MFQAINDHDGSKEKLSVAISNINLLSEEFIANTILAKAKTYDFLPIAYNCELLVSQIRQNMTEEKLRAQIDLFKKFTKIEKNIKEVCDTWRQNVYPIASEIKEETGRIHSHLVDIEQKHEAYLEKMRRMLLIKQVLLEFKRQISLNEHLQSALVKERTETRDLEKSVG